MSTVPTISYLKNTSSHTVSSRAELRSTRKQQTPIIEEEQIYTVSGQSSYTVPDTHEECVECNATSLTIAIPTALPIENIVIHDFKADWKMNGTILNQTYLVQLSWSQENNPITDFIEWDLLISNESDAVQPPLRIHKTCSANLQNSKNEYQVKLLPTSFPMHYSLVCSEDRHPNSSKLILNPCLSYDLKLVPIYENQQQKNSTRFAQLKSIIKWPPIDIESSYNQSNNLLLISWKSFDTFSCALEYRYDFNTAHMNRPVSEITNDTYVEFILESCTNYSISIWSIYDSGISSQSTNHTGRIKNEGFRVDDVRITNAQAINQTCILVDWSWRNRPFHQLANCNASFQIRLEPPSETRQSLWYPISSDKHADKEMLCQLRPGTEYKLGIQFFGNDELLSSGDLLPNIHSMSSIVHTPSALDGVTVGLIIMITLLIVALMCVAYAYFRASLKRHHALSRSGETLSLRTSFFGNLGRRPAHPVKVRNLHVVTQRLCSSAGHLLELEFEDLNVIADARRHKESPHALLPENTLKNRYLNILPYEHTRVILSLLPDVSRSDYVNASYILGFSGSRDYIASQGPKISTLRDFWRMIWEQNVHIIVMVTGLEERGKPKCDRYWPEDVLIPLTFDHTGLTVCLLNEEDFENYTLRNIKVQLGGKCRTVKQAYLKEWPDFGVPESPEILVRFIEVVRILVNETTLPDSRLFTQPILVHCSAGVGRTGTFIAVDWLMQEARVRKEIDIFSTVLRMRECRINMVQSEEQYEYVYRCLTHFANTRLFSETISAETSLSDAETLLATNGNNHSNRS